LGFKGSHRHRYWCALRIVYNAVNETTDLSGEVVNMAARSEPMAKDKNTVSDLLISESARYQEEIKSMEGEFDFIEQCLPTAKAFVYEGKQIEQGDKITCYAVLAK
jgi:hypothetical protein